MFAMNLIKNTLTQVRYLFLPALLLAITFNPDQAEAQRGNNFITAQDFNATIIPRMSHSEAEAGITNRDGSVDLMLKGESLVIQFSDQFLEKVEDEIKKEEIGDTSHLGTVIRAMVSSGVKTLLDRAMAIPLAEVSEIYYKDGRLYIISHDGREMFENLEIDGTPIMEDFRRRDARRFAEEAEKRMI
jgi:hypothetical protein